MQEFVQMLYWIPGFATLSRAYHRVLNHPAANSGVTVARRAPSTGQGLVEYALIIALVAVVVIATLILLGPQVASIFRRVSSNL